MLQQIIGGKYRILPALIDKTYGVREITVPKEYIQPPEIIGLIDNMALVPYHIIRNEFRRKAFEQNTFNEKRHLHWENENRNDKAASEYT